MDDDELKTMIDDILNREEKLSDWELNFISDIQFNDRFSPRQEDVINSIWDRVTD